MRKKQIAEFQKLVWDFYKKNGRNFPWRNTQDPYHILVSEVMLQQTQADRVVRYYERWLKRFPSFTSLADAKFSDIYPLWQGLGYNRRALALKKAAEKAIKEYQEKLPVEISLLEEFPGIGTYTARAISIFCYNTPIVCIETNIRRAFIYHFFQKKKNVSDQEILKVATEVLDKKNSCEWHWALMDYGAWLGTTLSLSKGGNPNRRHRSYTVQSKFKGSLRQVRGATLKILSVGPMNNTELTQRLKKITLQNSERIKKALLALEKEGFVKKQKNRYDLG